MRPNKWNRARARKQHVPGQMNGTEAAYAEVLAGELLAGEILGYQFEPMKFRLAKNTSYSPDFMVQLSDGTLEFREVKACRASGAFLAEDDAMVKIKVAAEMYPMFGWVMCGKLPRKAGWKIERHG